MKKTLFTMFIIAVNAILFLAAVCSAFNIDLSTHVEYRRPSSTLFGFAVAAHKEANVGW